MSRQPSLPQQATALEREKAAFELFKSGLNGERIAEQLGVNRSTVSRIVHRVRKRLIRETNELANEQRELDLSRLNAILAAHWDKAVAGNLRSGGLVVKIIMQRAEILGYSIASETEKGIIGLASLANEARAMIQARLGKALITDDDNGNGQKGPLLLDVTAKSLPSEDQDEIQPGGGNGHERA